MTTVTSQIQTGESRLQPVDQRSPRTSLSYVLPTSTSRRVFERYSLGEANDSSNADLIIGKTQSQEARPMLLDLNVSPSFASQAERVQIIHQHDAVEAQVLASTARPSSPRHPAVQSALFLGTTSDPLPSSSMPPIMSLTASPTYTPPVAPRHRAYPQQPTYIIPSQTPNPMDPVLPSLPQQEEVCVECAMRDQEMADVDVTSPGVWDRDSDVKYEELKQREIEEEVRSISPADLSRPRARGALLTEQNLKQWLASNPREPASKQQTLHAYIKAQRTLLEAEALAQAQAMQEAKQFDNKMREVYLQIRQSTYDLSNGAVAVEDTGGFRITQPKSPISGVLASRHSRSRSREVTLLENGIIVEHVDVRREEREERERLRKEEKRARKLSRSSALDVTSIISAASNGQYPDGGLGFQPYSSYSLSSSMRPNSVLTVPSDIPPAYSQVSFSDIHSVGSTSPRRSKFLGFRSLTPGWRSRDSLAPSGISGSMIDMHVALEREPNASFIPPVEVNTLRHSQIWFDRSNIEVEGTVNTGKHEKKKNGLARIWRLVTGSGKNNVEARDAPRSTGRAEDDFPLTPPPPLSYLVDRGNGDVLMTNGRHPSTSSLPSIASQKLGGNLAGMSPPTPPSSALPSPVSSRPYGADGDAVEVRIIHDDHEVQRHDEIHGKQKPFGLRKTYPATSEPDVLGQMASNPPNLPPDRHNKSLPLLLREKSLPPLPGEAISRGLAAVSETRPRTVYSDDPRSTRLGFLPPNAPFRDFDVRRQSFGGMTSRPNIQTMPIKSQDPRRSFGLRYDEFGISRRSLGRLEVAQKPPSQTPVKRKSKFLSSILGAKQSHNVQVAQDPVSDLYQQFPPMRLSGSDGHHDMGMNGYATSTSRHSAFSMVGPTRPYRISSRKALEELVIQDQEFVAYRYPSKEQRLDTLR